MNFLTCNVSRCRYRHNRRLPKNVSLYMLPRDAPEHLRNQWKEVCTGRLVACSEHFRDSDFIRRKTSPESTDKFRPLKQNVVPKICLLGKKIVQEESGEIIEPGSSRKQEKEKDEEIIILKDSAQEADPLAGDIVQEVQEHKNTANAIGCRISEALKKNLLYDKVVLKESEKRIVIQSGPIEARLEGKPTASEISSPTVIPTPGVLTKVPPGKPPPTVSPDDEKKGPKVVIREVKLARKKFGDVLARQKIIYDKSMNLQRKDIAVEKVQKRRREDEPESVPESVKQPRKDNSSEIPEAGKESSENAKKSELLRKSRRKQIFRPDKLNMIPQRDYKAPPEVRKKPEEPQEKLPGTTEDDDDVIFLPQKIDVIDVEDDSDTEQPTRSPKCDTKCEYKSKILADKKTIKSLVDLKEKLQARRAMLEINNQRKFARHMATQSFLKIVPTILSKTQRDIIFGTSNPVVWQADEIRNALVLKNLSEDVYMFLRQVLTYPLPTLESLLAWEKNYPDESIRAKNRAREYEQEAEDEMMEDEVDEESEHIMLLSQVSVEINEENPTKKSQVTLLE